jgi:FkbM family methyltransferase
LGRIEQWRNRFGFLVDALRIRQMVSFVLGILPVWFREGKARVPIRCWSDILAYNEVFRVRVYDAVLADEAPSTFCDLGCQSGMVILRMASLGCRPGKALLIDANPLAVDRCRMNLRSAKLDGYSLLLGAVGCAADQDGGLQKTISFSVRPSELECQLAKHGRQKGDTLVEVPVIDLEAAWVNEIGDIPCELLKMDVEGAETAVLRHDKNFLARVQRVVLEWHEPFSSRRSVEAMLRDLGFGHFETVCDGDRSGVVFARKR